MTRPPPERPSLQHVADRAGVSPATVSRALHNPERLAPATLERVRRAIDQTGYRPNVFAAGLMHRSARILAAVIPDALNASDVDALRGVESQARRFNYFVLMVPRARLENHAALDAPALALADAVIVLDASITPEALAQIFTGRVPVTLARDEPASQGEALGEVLAKRVLTAALAANAGPPFNP